MLPILPEADADLSALQGPGRLIPGLEESCGALYEIGVSDDGTFVGITRDELEESLVVLRAMAFSIGCYVRIVRMIFVGDCEWTMEAQPQSQLPGRILREDLLVAEALVAPYMGPLASTVGLAALSPDGATSASTKNEADYSQTRDIKLRSEQLRVSLTGSTTSGKSSLLGTLSTSTLDNGRGKSRLSLLKHRHEIVSGVTSSLAQELIGYRDSVQNSRISASDISIINYASDNVSSWNDIHSASEGGRLVFVTDSAGHPRYRRTTVRGLVSWAPHWTLCCVAADDEEDTTGKIGATATTSEILGSAGLGVDLSKAHLELCLKLSLPLVIVITKLDLASKIGLRNTLTKVLRLLKAAGRRPAMLSMSADHGNDPQLQAVTNNDYENAKSAISSVPTNESHSLVPIVLTSAVTGTGVGKLHALLRLLPLQILPNARDSNVLGKDVTSSSSLFHVDEVFAMPPHPHSANADRTTPGSILSGYLRYGTIEVGDSLHIGPCNSGLAGDFAESPDVHRSSSYPALTKDTPRAVALSYDRQRPSSSDFTKLSSNHAGSDLQTWQEVRIMSLRNLRLPVPKLFAGQVGTVAVTFHNVGASASQNSLVSSANMFLRRGMVLIGTSKASVMPAYSRFTAVFPQPSLAARPGVLVIVYIASIRASARIVEVRSVEDDTHHPTDEAFDHNDNDSAESGTTVSKNLASQHRTEMTFDFTTTQEWIEIGTPVLVTPGGGPSLTGQPEQREIGAAGLDGYVGSITRALV